MVYVIGTEPHSDIGTILSESAIHQFQIEQQHHAVSSIQDTIFVNILENYSDANNEYTFSYDFGIPHFEWAALEVHQCSDKV